MSPRAACAEVAAVGVLTGWGRGLDALPADAARAAAGKTVVPLTIAAPAGDRFRRATRECVLGVAAVEALLEDARLDRDLIRGSATALVYVTAAAYGASNRAFIDATGTGSALHFPYTAPSAVPAEVAIEFGLTGHYVIMIGGAATTIDALWHAATLVTRGAAERALVLAVETFTECADVWARGRRLVPGPLTESAACALVVPGTRPVTYRPDAAGVHDTGTARRRAGETLACAPLIDLALARSAGAVEMVAGEWRGRRAALGWPPRDGAPAS